MHFTHFSSAPSTPSLTHIRTHLCTGWLIECSFTSCITPLHLMFLCMWNKNFWELRLSSSRSLSLPLSLKPFRRPSGCRRRARRRCTRTWSRSGGSSASRRSSGARPRSRSSRGCRHCRRRSSASWPSWSSSRRRSGRPRRCWSRTSSAGASSTSSCSRPWRCSSARLRRWAEPFSLLGAAMSYWALGL